MTEFQFAVRELAARFGEAFGKEPVLVGSESDTALLADSSRACAAFGPPRVGLDELVELVAGWVSSGGTTYDRPTHFEVRDGAF